jgi:hypothetical protein
MKHRMMTIDNYIYRHVKLIQSHTNQKHVFIHL